MVALNLLILLAHVILKKVMVAISARLCRDPEFGTPVRRLFYEHDREKDYWYVRPHLGQCRTLVKTVYTAAVPVLLAMMFASAPLMSRELLDQPFFPVFGMILMGEIYYFLDGLLEQEDQENQLEGEETTPPQVRLYGAAEGPAPPVWRPFGGRMISPPEP